MSAAWIWKSALGRIRGRKPWPPKAQILLSAAVFRATPCVPTPRFDFESSGGCGEIFVFETKAEESESILLHADTNRLGLGGGWEESFTIGNTPADLKVWMDAYERPPLASPYCIGDASSGASSTFRRLLRGGRPRRADLPVGAGPPGMEKARPLSHRMKGGLPRAAENPAWRRTARSPRSCASCARRRYAARVGSQHSCPDSPPSRILEALLAP